MRPPTQNAPVTSPHRKNQHVVATNTNTAITFRCLAKLDDINIRVLLSSLTMGISAGLIGITYASILQDAATQVCTVTFAQPSTATQAAFELNMKGLPEMTTSVITGEAPPPMPPNWDNQTIFEQSVRNVFAMPAYCIVQGCAHHSPSK